MWPNWFVAELTGIRHLGITLEYPAHPNPNTNPYPNPNSNSNPNPKPKVSRVRGLF